MMASYASWLLYDDYMLEDEDGNLVFVHCNICSGEWRMINENVGCTAKTTKRTYDARCRWMKVSMIESKEWKEGLRRFYWRARRTVLHTNAVKNRFDARWPDTCAVCEQGNATNSATLTPDTQDHRFGLSLPKCSDVVKLQDRLTTMYYAIEREQWLPDQSVLLPAISDTIAAATGHEQRTLWASDDVRAIRWRPMMQISADLWANAQWLEGIIALSICYYVNKCNRRREFQDVCYHRI
ncbi:LOW QUALITY PROTEIN: hypothetical protein PHMEG_00040918 [Phytophthora megakarya]|uniref:Uncharacterized protein n=1 Tax=Phytophthora megakarya TaxID=4795 RepID=A0A225UCN2_9STRA|nr:LOW QUALITY PROTEIN: hypothetical protein PHMEG_00040918 [Phytophthora megakarya]